MEQIAKISRSERLSQVLASRKELLYVISILGITFISFWPTFFNDFQMQWDDQWQVTNSYTTNGLGMAELRTSFIKGISEQYDPLNQLMYSLLWHIDGYNPILFHAACLLLHLANVCCVYYILRTILKDCTSLETGRIRWMVYITTIIFAIHPLQVESVAWISASKIVLSTLFYLLAGIMLIRFLKMGGTWNYIFSILFVLFSYFSKEAAVTFPLWATLLCLWYGHSPRKFDFWKILVPLYVIALFLGLHIIFVVTSYDQYVQGDTYMWWQRIVFSFYSLATYLFKWFVPINLSWMYQYPANMGEALPAWLLPYPLLVCILVYALWEWIRKPFFASAIVFLLIHLLFVLHILVLPRDAVIADRYMYLPMLGLNVILAYLLTSHIVGRNYKKIVTVLFVLLILLCTILSYQRTKEWKDSATLKNEEVIDNINSNN